MSRTLTTTTTRVIDRLRAGTASAHERLDAQFASAGWLDDPAGLADCLTVIAGCHGAVERLIAHSPLVRITGHGPKCDLLERDLDTLGRRGAPVVVDVPVPAFAIGDDAVLGMLYVIEGSTLGGRRIAGMVRSAFDAPWSSATTLLDPYGADTPIRWRRTLATIEQHVTSPERCVEAAAWAFGLFAIQLAEAGGVR
ncbi:MAG: biliverdin-producing heme oxygenase [Ilumatobacteraceae bacterium]